MPRPKSENNAQTALRLPSEALSRADALIPRLSKDGFQITRTDALRAALLRGLVALETLESRKRQIERLEMRVRLLSRIAEKFVIDGEANSRARKTVDEIEKMLRQLASLG